MPGMTRSGVPRELEDLVKFDGQLAPQFAKEILYIAAFSQLDGWGYSALSWWDRTVDDRPGSNSTIFCPATKISPEMILHGAEQPDRFAKVLQRLPKPLTLWIAKW